MKRIIGLTFILGLCSACVSSGTHEELKQACAKEEARLKGEISTRDEKIASLEGELAALNEKIQATGAKLAATEKSLGDSQGETEKLRDDLAKLLKDRSRLRASIKDMSQALAELEKRRKEAEARVAEFKALIERFKPLIDTGKLRVKIVDGRMVVELPTDVLFKSGSAKLSEDGQSAVAEVGTILATVEERRFQVEGHTDNVPIKTATFPSNWELASQRAINVVKTMIEAGMPPARISAASFSEHKPAASNETDEGKAANRRIEIVVVPDLSSLPGFEELKALAEGNS